MFPHNFNERCTSLRRDVLANHINVQILDELKEFHRRNEKMMKK
jgi:hypothetical protein